MEKETLGMYVWAPDLTEVGQFYCWGDTNLEERIKATEKKLETQFAFATTVPGQKNAESLLEGLKWTDMGHRYNQYHGPNFITLWFKEFPKNDKAAKVAAPKHSIGWLHPRGTAPNGAYSCGIWTAAHDFDEVPKYIETKYLAIWRLPKSPTKAQLKELKENDWKHVGDSAVGGSIWHTAEPHKEKNKYGAPTWE